MVFDERKALLSVAQVEVKRRVSCEVPCKKIYARHRERSACAKCKEVMVLTAPVCGCNTVDGGAVVSRWWKVVELRRRNQVKAFM